MYVNVVVVWTQEASTSYGTDFVENFTTFELEEIGQIQFFWKFYKINNNVAKNIYFLFVLFIKINRAVGPIKGNNLKIGFRGAYYHSN